ncbi:MAG: nucleotide exchange factor GrpE [Halieaceae bacterium]|nr:nucleotide exchange factor GrpE [Halieaceae bacterium]
MKNKEEVSEEEKSAEEPKSESVDDDSIKDDPLKEDPPNEIVDSEESSEKSEEEIAVDSLSELEVQLEEMRDQVLRHQAEVQNVKRRAEQDVEKARKYALERFCNELLPIVDSLEMAILSASPDQEESESILKGIKLTLKMFVDTLAKFNLEQIDPEGEPFDPKLHQAVSMVENNEVEPNTVLSVMQRGYVLSGRLIRPAMVVVSKASE